MKPAVHPRSARYLISSVDPETGLVNAIIEAPRGSRHKYKFDPSNGTFFLDKSLPAGAAFPFDFGFIPGTQAADGDPLDILVMLEEPSVVGAIGPARLVGVIEAEQTELSGETVRNDRLLAVLETRYNPSRFRSLAEIDQHLIAEIEHFFSSYNEMEGRDFRSVGRAGDGFALARAKPKGPSRRDAEVLLTTVRKLKDGRVRHIGQHALEPARRALEANDKEVRVRALAPSTLDRGARLWIRRRRIPCSTGVNFGDDTWTRFPPTNSFLDRAA